MLSADPSKRIFVLKRDETSSRKPSSDHAVEGIYDRIKALLLAHTLAPGQLLQIGTLAEELGVSTTPVREALTRLAAERLIVFAPKRGFFAKTASEDELRGLYTLNQTLLDSAIREWTAAAQAEEEARAPSKIFASMPLSDKPEQLTRTVDDLFVRIATRSGIGELADIVRNFNDRLHHARMIEGEIIEDAVEELSNLRQLYGDNDQERLQAALQKYHQRRREMVSSICKELLFRPFLAENK
ncbi:GntR family transcriptional regulator [Steroidobacter sp. S1-65]|uniref:GntR family transcriptional regulator n=1 Tax=Steroidobacter gossypii TaxID=2805490 RepID=A0ABS1X605_9GAMM|nr:GntR family transcriptional regulator [Steroidobacter gossypii]MBM0108662.1 GntR family transcriptional regulator [Steroidobacter gossypii]